MGNLQTSTPYTTQECSSYTPTYPDVPVPQTPKYLNIIEPGPVVGFKPGIYWERCVEAYFPGGGFLVPGGATVSGYDSTEGTTTTVPKQNYTLTLLGA